MQQANKIHQQLVTTLSNADISPETQAWKMLHESKYVNESLIQYIVAFVSIWGTRKPEYVPPYMQNVWRWCNEMYQMLDKMDMTYTGARSSLNN
jgi:F0F1-type ATP synthase membrane subunit a